MVEVDVEAPGPAAAADDWDLDPPEMSNQFYFVTETKQMTLSNYAILCTLSKSFTYCF